MRRAGKNDAAVIVWRGMVVIFNVMIAAQRKSNIKDFVCHVDGGRQQLNDLIFTHLWVFHLMGDCPPSFLKTY